MTSKLTIKKKDDGRHDIRINGKTFMDMGLLVTSFDLHFDADELPTATIEVTFIEVDMSDG